MGAFFARLIRIGMNKAIPYKPIKPEIGDEFDFIDNLTLKCKCCGAPLNPDRECGKCTGVCVVKKQKKSRKGTDRKKKWKKKKKSSQAEGVEDVKIFGSVIKHKPPSSKKGDSEVKKQRFFRPRGMPKIGTTPPIYF